LGGDLNEGGERMLCSPASKCRLGLSRDSFSEHLIFTIENAEADLIRCASVQIFVSEIEREAENSLWPKIVRLFQALCMGGRANH
jgi:hypothetical protein